jgi:hypothetical protein
MTIAGVANPATATGSSSGSDQNQVAHPPER